MKQASETTKYLLRALVPYSRANLILSYKPRVFFYELERKSKLNSHTLRSAYDRAIKAGLIELDLLAVPRLTPKGLSKIKPYKPIKLGSSSYLLISFDIPESERFKRDHLRYLLKELACTKIHQSLWTTKYDHRQYLTAEIKEYGLESYVVVYEAVKLSIE